jgi:SAM-dependent methyltransferase
MDFNNTKDSYREKIEQSIAFSGKSLNYFTDVKADYLQKIVSEQLPNIAHPKLLDVGCGHGYIHPKLLDFGFEVVGVEVASEVLPIAKKINKKVSYVSYDGAILPFLDSTFDVVLAICVMHHVPPDHWQKFVSELSRVLRPSGLVVIFEHNPFNPLTRYVVSSNEIDADAVLLSARTTRSLLNEGGFAEVKTRNILFTPFSTAFFRALDEKLGWCPFGAQYYAFGRVS